MDTKGMLIKMLTCGHERLLKRSRRSAYCGKCGGRKRVVAGQSREWFGPAKLINPRGDE